MTNIVMICKDRPRLTEQTLRTLYDNTPKDQFNLTVVDDGEENAFVLGMYLGKYGNISIALSYPTVSGCVGGLKNQGAELSAANFGRGDYLCFIDNDIAFFPGWLDTMIGDYDNAKQFGVKILGGYRHPYHQPITSHANSYPIRMEALVELTDAVAGYLHFMSWSTWDRFGPYDANSKGVCQSEDHAICRRVVDAGGLVGYVHPPCIAVCGVTNTEGNPAIGSESIPRLAGLVYE